MFDVLSYHSQIGLNFELIKATANPGLTMALTDERSPKPNMSMVQLLKAIECRNISLK